MAKDREVRKVFVPDTSVILHDPRSIVSFENNIVAVPIRVLDELDDHKRRGDPNTAAAARQAIRILDALCEKGPIHRGVETPGGGLLFVDGEGFTNGMSLDAEASVDNFIISVAAKWRSRQEWIQRQRGRSKKNGSEEDIVVNLDRRFTLSTVALITKDINLRVRARSYRVAAQDYLRDRAVASEDQLYTGIVRIPIDQDQFQEIGRTLSQKPMLAEEIAEIVDLPELLPNQCVIFDESGDRPLLAIYKRGGEEEGGEPSRFVYVPRPKQQPRSGNKGVEPRNAEQAFAYALLMDPTIKLVTLSGIAGAGKTLMGLKAGLDQLAADKTPRFKKLTVYRPNVEIGEKLGALKGGLKQKFAPWATPIHDDLELLDMGGETEMFEVKKERSIYGVNSLREAERIVIDPINYIQGRTLHYTYVIVDETQNFRPGDMKKVITRAGKGTKMVLTGDVTQIESPFLDALTNGLSHVIERFKGRPIFAHLTMPKSERSDLAELAAQLL
jgi:PhoH-like ATPase